jgi:threonine dehydratase
MLALADLIAAHNRIRPHIIRTPVLTSSVLNRRIGAQLFWKAENLQKTGAFKARGATNAVFALDDPTARRGVVTHSSGNHAGALARAAQRRGIPAHVVMPSNVPDVKRATVSFYGARIISCEPSLAAREAGAAQALQETGGTLIHPYNDLKVIAGQGTAALELLDDVPDLDLLLAPVGGGGLLSGTAVAIKSLRPRARVIGVEPSGADDAARSFRSGERAPPPHACTIADGLRGALGDLTFMLIRQHVDDIVTVSEEAIVTAMRLLWEHLKVVVEPSAATPLAGLLENRVPDASGHRIGIILSGGNVDLDHLPWKPTQSAK